MAQTSALVNTLKKELKAQGRTYADVAYTLDLSEASVKRLFAQADFSLSRLDAICQLLNLEISDLVRQMEASQKRLQQLTHQQEMELTQDLWLLLITVCIFNRWSIEDITRLYDITETACVAKLLKLDALGIIELGENNRIKLLLSPNFKWQDGGPIQRFFKEQVGREYFNVGFNQEGESLTVLNGMLSKSSNRDFQRKLERLAQEFESLNTADANLDFEEREGFTLVLAIRHWEYGLFHHMLRQPY